MKDELSQNFRELNLTILTSIGLGLSLGIVGEVISTILIGNYESQYIYLYFVLFVGITAAFAFLIIWFSLPRVLLRDFIQCATTYDLSRKIFFDYFYTYDEFGIIIHHLSRIINENRPVKILFEKDDRLVLSFAEYTILRLLFADLHLYYNQTEPMSTTEIFTNGILQDISRVPNYRINLPKGFTIKRSESSFLIIEGDNLRFKICGGVFSQPVQALYLRPIPKIRDIPIRPNYEEEVISKIRSNDLLLYIFNFNIQAEFKNSKIESIRSRIRRNSKFSDKVDLITNSIHNLRERTSVNTLIERIYQQIEEDRLEGFFENERRRQR